MALEWLNNNPEYELAEIIEDKGKSAYNKTNFHKGSLGQFVKDAEAGYIPEGSILVCEAVDRISRAGIDFGRRILDRIVDTGVDIHIIKFNTTLSKSGDGNDLLDTLNVASGLWLGHEESKQKSARVTKSMILKYIDADEKGIKFKTGVRPAWIDLDHDGNFILNEGKSEVIREIFRLRIDDKMGDTAIARQMKSKNIPPIGQKWSRTAVQNILNAKQLIGEYHPMKRYICDKTGMRKEKPQIIKGRELIISDYYPPVLDEDYFLRVTFPQKLKP